MSVRPLASVRLLPRRSWRVTCKAQRRDLDALDFDEQPQVALKKTPRHIRRLQLACATTLFDGSEEESHRVANRLRARADELEREARRRARVEEFPFLDL